MKRGFTLIEALIYLAIVAILIPVVIELSISIINSGALNRDTREARAEAARALQIITQTIRNGSTVTTPAFNSTSTTLVVDSTNFSLDASQIKIQDGSTSSPLTAAGFQISDLLFTNSSRFGTPSLVNIKFKIKKGNLEKKYYGSAAIRKK